jgi:hypothetical protein
MILAICLSIMYSAILAGSSERMNRFIDNDGSSLMSVYLCICVSLYNTPSKIRNKISILFMIYL